MLRSRRVRSYDAFDRAAIALVAAEGGESAAWRLLDEAALRILAADASSLAASVPFALARLCQQLAAHPRTTARLRLVRTLKVLIGPCPAEAGATLWRLTHDASRRVRVAAKAALADVGLSEAFPLQ